MIVAPSVSFEGDNTQVKDLLPDWSLLRRNADFARLYAGQLVSGFGSAITYVVLPVEMYRLTQSPLLVGLLGVAEFVPMLLIAFIGGLLADRLDRRHLLLFTDTLMGLVLAALTFNSMAPTPQVWPLFAGASLLAGLGAIHRPAMEAMTPQLVSPTEMPAVAALTSLRFNVAYIAGPAIGGWIAVVYGASFGFGLDALTYAASVLALYTLRRREFRGGEEGGITWHGLLEGWRYALERKDLLGTYLIDMNAMFFGMPNALFPAFGAIYGEQYVGLLYAAGPVGALLVSLTSGWTKSIRRHGLAISWAAGIWGLAIMGFGFSTQILPALFCLALAGAADNVSGIFRSTIWNQTIPARLRGRTAAIEMVSYLSGPYLGNAEAGFAVKLMGLGPSVVMGGALCVLGTIAITWALPPFRSYRAEQ